MIDSPIAIQKLAGLLAVATLATLAWGAWLTFASGPAVWGMFGYEIVIAAAAISALVFALGKNPDSPAITLACIALAILVSAGMGLVATGLLPGPVLRHPLFLARFAIVAAFTLLAVLAALKRNPEAWRTFLRGSIITVISIGALVGGYKTARSNLIGPGVGQLLIIIVSVLASVGFMGAFCIGAHLVIRAFEIASDDASNGSAKPRATEPRATSRKARA